jgi:hypothetical protein
MTRCDEDDLIDGLRSGIAERQSGISAPDGIGDQARRSARKRIVTRVVGAGVPMLAAAGVAVVLVLGSGSEPTPAGAVSGPVVSAATGPVKIQDTAYIVRRVKANVADRQSGMVIHGYSYARGEVGADGSLVNLGSKLGDEYDYAAPDGTVYMRSAWNNVDGSPYLTGTNVLVPDGHGGGKGTDTRTLLNPITHTYTQARFSGVSDPKAGLPTPNLYSSASEVRQALASGQVTQQAPSMVNGTPAIALSITLPGAAGEDLTLDVDAQTYQPLRTVITLDGKPDLLVADWVPATPDRIAQATDDSIPAGYTKADTVYH